MPHKQNPIVCERICGLARILRANMLAAYEDINLWHERDISHSSVERIILPDSTIALVYMLKQACKVIKNLRINSAQMLKNIELNRGIIYSQKMLIKLMSKGLSRMKAYDIVQDITLKVINDNSNFREVASNDAKNKKIFK